MKPDSTHDAYTDARTMIHAAQRIAMKLEAIPQHHGDAADLYHLAEFIERTCIPIEYR